MTKILLIDLCADGPDFSACADTPAARRAVRTFQRYNERFASRTASGKEVDYVGFTAFMEQRGIKMLSLHRMSA